MFERTAFKVIDTHVHVWALDDLPGHRPDPNARVPVPKAAVPVEWLIQDMERLDIAKCVLVQSSGFGWDNRYMVESLERYPGRFRAIGLVDPMGRDNAQSLVDWMKRGLYGFRLHPLYYRDSSWVDAEANDALWDAAAETGAILQFHMRPDHAAAVGRMKERHPGVRVVIDHLGKPDVLEPAPYPSYQGVLRLAELPDVWVKIGDYQIASQQSFPWRDTWPFVTLLKEAFGPDRMLWGTGYAGSARLVQIEQALEYVKEQLPLTECERRTILWDTPAGLFGFTE